MNKRLNDKGSTLVTVVVALAVVGTLAVIVLWVSLINFQMKITDEGVKNNFYSAETVLDQIKAGLQGEISDAYNSAYTKVMENYSSYTEEERKSVFTQLYIEKLRKSLRSEENGGSDLRYSMVKIKGFVSSDLLDTTTYPYTVVTSTTATMSHDQNSNEEVVGNDGLLTAYEDRLVIKGIKVVYVDARGYSSEIETDIALGIPAMDFQTAEDLPETFTYALIGNSGLRFTATGIVDIQSSLYAGCQYAIDPNTNVFAKATKKGPSNEVSMTVDIGSTVSFSNGKYVIADGNVLVNNGASLTVSEDMQLWTQNIYVESANAFLKGTSYLSDDLTLMGNAPAVKLGSENKTGKFVAYGYSQELANESSSVIINGKNSILDMSGLDDLFIAGYSFISSSQYQSKINNSLVTNNDIKMGSSISLKGDQVAYLVPGECIGTAADNSSKFNKNPLTYNEYIQIVNNEDYKFVNTEKVSKRTKHSLKNYFDSGETEEDCISTVFVPGSSGGQDDILVYVYVSLSGDNASRYYKDFYDNNSDRLNTYAKFYADAIVSNDTASRVYTAGTYCLFDDQERTLSLFDQSEGTISEEVALVESTYNCLKTTLKSDYQNHTAEELGNTVFANVIDENKLTEAMAGAGSMMKTIEYTDNNGKSYKAILINDADSTYTYNGSDSSIKLIVTRGNVEVSADFEGTIIAFGEINVKKSAVIKNSEIGIMKKLISHEINGTDLHMYDIFDECTQNISIGITGSNETEESEDTSYADIIVYENWTKK